MTKVSGNIVQLKVTGSMSQLKVSGNIVQGGFNWIVYWLTRYPSDLTAAIISDTQIDLAWTNNGNVDYDGISIERSLDGITYTEIDTIIPGVAYSDITCVGDTLYYYRIRYYRGTHYSAYSNEADITDADWTVYWTAYWTAQFDFFYIGGLNGDTLKDITGNGYDITITGKDFSGDYIPYTSEATFQIPSNATLIADDTDFLWFNRNGEVRNVEVSELVGYDFARTIVKFDNSTPYNIRYIGILKSGVTLTEAQIDRMHTDFELALFWSGVENVNGFIKGNRGLAQNVWPVISVAALNYSDTYETAVLADSGTIVSRKVLESEYQRLINTGDITKCWFSYHFKCGVKINVVNYGLGNKNMVYKWYNLSPVAGRFAESVFAYSIVAGTDARPEYTTSGLLFRPTNLDGGIKCGLESGLTILTNNNNKIRWRAIHTPVGASWIARKGYLDDAGETYIRDLATTRKLTLGYRYTATTAEVISTDNNVFVNATEVEVETTVDYTAKTVIMKKNGGVIANGGFPAVTPIYPAHDYQDCIGCARSLARTPADGYIKQIELFAL